MHEEGLRSELAQGTGAGSMHAASAHAVSTTTHSSQATGTTTSGNPMSAAIGALSTDSRQQQLTSVDRPMHPHAVELVATAPNHRPPHAHVEGGKHNDYSVPPPIDMFPPPGATGYGLPPSLVPVAVPPVGAPPQVPNVGTFTPAVVLGATGGGAAGQAAAVPQSGTLAGVVTRDSVSDYGTQAAAIQTPAANAPVQVRSLPIAITTGRTGEGVLRLCALACAYHTSCMLPTLCSHAV